jgi:hypothetical protein
MLLEIFPEIQIEWKNTQKKLSVLNW